MFEVNTKDMSDYGRHLVDSAKSIRKLTLQALSNLGTYAKALARQELEDVRYTGALEDSFVVEEEEQKLRVLVYPTAKHRMYVRMGTRPHWAPIGPLKRWAAVKLGDENAAYPVQRSIAEHGTSMYQMRKRGTKANPWPKRVIDRPDFKTAVRRTMDGLGKEVTAEAVRD